MSLKETEIIIYTKGFEPTDELTELAQILNYTSPFDPMFCKDPNAVKFVKERLEGPYDVYKGRPSGKFRIGYAGFAQIVKVDISRTWRLRSNYGVCIGYQEVEYVDVYVSPLGQAFIFPER